MRAKTYPSQLPAILEKYLQEEDDPSAFLEALTAIGRGAKSTERTVLRCLGHRNAGVRCEAANALGELGGESAIPPLCVMVEEDEEYVAQAAELALHKVRARVKRRE